MSTKRIDADTIFTGKQEQIQEKEIDDFELSFVESQIKPIRTKLAPEPYRASPELVDAVNVAIALGRPLLLQGEPGCGKTRLAYSVAYELGLPLEEGYIKSTSRAQDLLYTYDAINRLYDAQLTSAVLKEGSTVDEDGSTEDDSIKVGDVRDIRNYLKFGPLGRAIARAEKEVRSVVLIDEIDKADLDFPNDLLLELDRLRFQVENAPELKFEAPQKFRPIVFITHNEEKALPTAFLRRCVYHYVEFPDTLQELQEILKLHSIDSDEAVAIRAISVLRNLRRLDLSKKPGLSELIDWVGYLQYVNATEEELDQIPNIGVLLKKNGDITRVRESLESLNEGAG